MSLQLSVTFEWGSSRMRWFAAGGVVATCAAAAQLAAIVVLTSRADAAQRLSGATLHQNIPGARINLDTPLGTVVPVAYGTDGTLQGSAGAVSFYLGAARDRGKWWIEGSRLCHQWTVWFNGRKKCFEIVLKPANRIEWSEPGGDSGTGTIVSLGRAPQSAPRQFEVAAAPRTNPPATAEVARPQVARPQVARSATVRSSARSEPPGTDPKLNRSASGSPQQRPPQQRPPEQRHLVRAAGLGAPKPLPEPRATPKPWATSVDRAALAAGPLFSVVNVADDDVLNIRRGPSAATEIVATIPPRASTVRMQGKCAEEWCLIRYGGNGGWVNRYFLAPLRGSRPLSASAKDARYAVSYRVVRVPAHDVLNVRRNANADAAIVATIPPNARKIQMTGFCAGDWCPVSHRGGSGWVNRIYLALDY